MRSNRWLSLLVMLGLVATASVTTAAPAYAVPEPSFLVTCYPTAKATNDPIVFPGETGKSHLHTFYGAKGIDQNTTAATLAAATSSQCGSNFDGVDLSGYWIPTLYQKGAEVYTTTGQIQLRAYYKRAGGADGQLVDQAYPRGLKMIAGDMMATEPNPHIITYFCAETDNTGSQGKESGVFPTCAANESLVVQLVFPDCWDGKLLDSTNHRSHMAYSGGAGSVCPASHPVKLAQLTLEAWFYRINGNGADFSWASGGPYSFHGDVFSMWQAQPAANLVNQCLNFASGARDCNPLMYDKIPTGTVTQAQIDAQYLASAAGSLGVPPAASGGSTSPSVLSPTPKPTIAGIAKVKKKLTAKAGAWGPAPVKLSYKWYRSGKTIKGATKSTYRLVKADRKKRITVRVTGKKAGYPTVSQLSGATRKVR